MKGWGEQVDELVVEGSYDEAIKLLDTIDEAVLPDKVSDIFYCFRPTTLRYTNIKHVDDVVWYGTRIEEKASVKPSTQSPNSRPVNLTKH